LAVAAEHYLSLSLSYLAATIDASKLWRALCAQPDYEWAALKTLADGDTSPSALARIIEGPYLGEPSKPACFIRYANQSDVEAYATTGLDVRGAMMMNVEAQAPAAYKSAGNLPDANRWFTNCLGRLIVEMQAFKEANRSVSIDFSGIRIGPIGLCFPDDRASAWIMTGEFTVLHSGEVG
jgi:hypothetical protein